MTISNVSSSSPTNAAQNVSATPPPAKPAAPKQDSVQLSNAAKQSSGDVDHDGDSH
jgi:hypothetical protein